MYVIAVNIGKNITEKERVIMNEEIFGKIEKLKINKNAIIAAHYYAPDKAQQIADFVGDSYYLAKRVKSESADIVVFCGVNFMGESVKILNPKKKVLMPDINADCAMAHMAQVEKINELRDKYDDLAVVCYVNSTAALKCQSDVCVTSSNAVKIVKALENKNIFFIPDKNLGRYVARQLPDKNIILNDGCCPIHNALSVDNVRFAKEKYPKALVLTHPECQSQILEMSDFVGSTADIIAFANKSDCDEFIICTEIGVGFELKKKNPSKRFYFASNELCCNDMKLNTVDKILKVLENETNEIIVDESTIKRAAAPLNRMLELAEK